MICKEFNIQPSEIDKMVYFEYEYILEDIKEYQDDQQSKAEAQEKQQAQWQQQMGNPMSNIKMPPMPKFNMPNFSTKF